MTKCGKISILGFILNEYIPPVCIDLFSLNFCYFYNLCQRLTVWLGFEVKRSSVKLPAWHYAPSSNFVDAISLWCLLHCQLMATTVSLVERIRPSSCGTPTSWRTLVTQACCSRHIPAMATRSLMPSVRVTALSCARAVLIRLCSCGTLQPARSPASTEDMQVCIRILYIGHVSCLYRLC